MLTHRLNVDDETRFTRLTVKNVAAWLNLNELVTAS